MTLRIRGPVLIPLTVLLLMGNSPGQTPCRQWDPGFGLNGVNGWVDCATVFNDGGGRALYAGGWFTVAGNAPANCVARWDGREWSALGQGENDTVHALLVFDDGTGPALYAAGRFRENTGTAGNGIAKWDGSSWVRLGTGLQEDIVWIESTVDTLAVFDDGSGPALYAGGQFDLAGGAPANNIARWDGSSWSALGSGLVQSGNGDPGEVKSLAVFDDGTGPALYAAGYFDTAGGTAASFVARWNGSSWAPAGGSFASWVQSLRVFDDGSGPILVGGGRFAMSGGPWSSGIAEWNGTMWSPLGGGIPFVAASLAVGDVGQGPELFVELGQGIGGGPDSGEIARWNGSVWSRLDTRTFAAAPLACYDDGHGPSLFVGGSFHEIGGIRADGIASWRNSRWEPVAIPIEHNGLDGWVSSLTVFDDGTGRALYAGGRFRLGPSFDQFEVAKWNGTAWSSCGRLGSDNGWVAALEPFDDGSGSALYAGGYFTIAGDLRVNGIAQWDGARWLPLGRGVDLDHGNQGYVDALARFETGGRSVLCAGGLFAYAGGQPASNVASWDGASWTPLGSGIDGRVIALTTFDDGSGPALYAAGYFSTAGSMPANNIAKWNGSAWAPLGSGIRAASYWEGVLALAVFDDGSGSALYAGGGFATAGGLPASGIARWNGTRWEPVGRGIGGSASAFTIFDDGAGEALYVGGDFHRAGGERATGIARWNSSGWTAVLNAPNWTGALAVFDDRTGGGADLYAGGPFVAAGHFASSAIAKWRECAPIPSLR